MFPSYSAPIFCTVAVYSVLKCLFISPQSSNDDFTAQGGISSELNTEPILDINDMQPKGDVDVYSKPAPWFYSPAAIENERGVLSTIEKKLNRKRSGTRE
mmetsp:Transcript_32466/g.74727  ORF Transcript_32466/g.74727 Transcript_32466/m.74727 type:complete len:100 (-) Transcript_32466:204-503(-)